MSTKRKKCLRCYQASIFQYLCQEIFTKSLLQTSLRSHRVLPTDNTDAVLFRRGLLLYKDKLLLKICVNRLITSLLRGSYKFKTSPATCTELLKVLCSGRTHDWLSCCHKNRTRGDKMHSDSNINEKRR